MTINRIQNWQIPKGSSVCHLSGCVYKRNGICGSPRINKGNGDAVCHKMNNKVLLSFVAALTA